MFVSLLGMINDLFNKVKGGVVEWVTAKKPVSLFYSLPALTFYSVRE